MRFTCDRSALLSALQLVASAAAARTTKPILSNVKASAAGIGDDTLTLVAYDTEVGIRLSLRGVDVREPGDAILQLSTLAHILKECDDKDVTITANDDGAKVSIGSSRFELPGYPAAEFPDLSEFADKTQYHEITASDLRTMLKRTVFATDKKDSTRFALSGVLWEAEGRTARLIATDSRRLAVCEGAAMLHGDGKRKGNAVVPIKALGLLEKNLTDEGGLIRVALGANEAMFQTERAMIYTRLIEGRYPPYRDIMGQCLKSATKKIPIPVEAFLGRVRQAAIMTDDEAKRVEFTFSSGKVTMQAKGAETGSSEVVMMLPDYDGDTVTIAFDPKFVIEFLQAIKPEVLVVLEMSDGSKPAMFKCGDVYQYLVMPLAW